ncbi:MAG: 6-bladed beta-propeller, partial [Longimicrobiales bacterium]
MLRASIVIAAITTAFASIAPLRLAAQQQILVPDSVACRQCSITAVRVVTLGDERQGILSSPQSVIRDGAGRYIVVHVADQTGMSIFSPNGEFLRRVGRGGRGPGEYGLITGLQPDTGGILRVWDAGATRLTVLDRDFVTREVVPFETLVVSLVRYGSGYYAFRNVRTPELAGYPLHRIDMRGRIQRSFGASEPGYRSDRPDLYRRSIALGPAGTLWSGRFVEYVLERWDTAGTLLQRLRRAPAWFPPGIHVGAPAENRRARPAPGLMRIRVDSSGRIWTLVWV